MNTIPRHPVGRLADYDSGTPKGSEREEGREGGVGRVGTGRGEGEREEGREPPLLPETGEVKRGRDPRTELSDDKQIPPCVVRTREKEKGRGPD